MAWLTVLGPAADQVEYRLAEGAGCDGQLAAERERGEDAAVDYRIGDDGERPVERVGAGWARLGHAAGQLLHGEAERDTVRAVMAGIHPQTGEVLVKAKRSAHPASKVAAEPLVEAVRAAAAQRGVAVEGLLSPKQKARWGRLERGLLRDGSAHRAPVGELELIARAAGVDPGAVWEPGVLAQARRYDGHTVRTGNRGYDLTLNVPKSVSVLHGLADPATARVVEEEYLAAVRETVAQVEAWVAYGVSGHLGEGQTPERVNGDGLAATITLHRSARPVGNRVGDPHLHAHVMIANLVHCADGKWRALVGRDLHRHTHAAGEYVKARVRARLSERLGLVWERAENGEWEVAGIGPELRGLFSARHDQVLAAAGEGAGRARQQAAATRTAQAKTGPTWAVSARSAWRAAAEAAGVWPQRLVADVVGRRRGAPARVPAVAELAAQVWDAEHGATAQRKATTRAHVMSRVAAACPDGIGHGELEALTDAVIAAGPVVALPETTPGYMSSGARMTTADVVEAEQRITTAARDRLREGAAAVALPTAARILERFEAEKGFALSAEQRRAVVRLTVAGHGLDAVIGAAGAGKTTAMDAARTVWEAQGYRVAGAAPSAVAAATLSAEAHIEARTVAGWLAELDRKVPHGHTPERAFGGAHVLVLDEAAMVDDRALDRLLAAAQRAGVKVAAIGDPQQLSPVGIGGGFAAVHDIVQGEQLAENRRQRDAGDRAALELWRSGQRSGALATWGEAGRVHTAAGAEQTRVAAVAAWWADRRTIDSGLDAVGTLALLAPTNADVDALNAAARVLAREHGLLHGPDTVVRTAGGGRISLAVGDQVRIRRNDYRSRHSADPDVLNGYRGVVEHASAGGVEVCWRRGGAEERAVLTRDQVARGDVTHAYAATIASAQGQTVDRAHVIGTGADAHALYPAMSRARERSDLYLDASVLESAEEQARLGEARSDDEQLRRAIGAYGRSLVDRDEGLVLEELGVPEQREEWVSLADRERQAAQERADARITRRQALSGHGPATRAAVAQVRADRDQARQHGQAAARAEDEARALRARAEHTPGWRLLLAGESAADLRDRAAAVEERAAESRAQEQQLRTRAEQTRRRASEADLAQAARDTAEARAEHAGRAAEEARIAAGIAAQGTSGGRPAQRTPADWRGPAPRGAVQDSAHEVGVAERAEQAVQRGPARAAEEAQHAPAEPVRLPARRAGDRPVSAERAAVDARFDATMARLEQARAEREHAAAQRAEVEREEDEARRRWEERDRDAQRAAERDREAAERAEHERQAAMPPPQPPHREGPSLGL